MLKPPSNCLTDRTKAVLHLWIRFVISVLCLSNCLVCFLQPCDHLLGKDWPALLYCMYFFLCFVTFPYGVLGQVLYLIVSIPNMCLLPYFYNLGDK